MQIDFIKALRRYNMKLRAKNHNRLMALLMERAGMNNGDVQASLKYYNQVTREIKTLIDYN